MNVHERFSNRCRHCGIRVPRGEMIYNHRAYSEDCADELWIKYTFRSELD